MNLSDAENQSDIQAAKPTEILKLSCYRVNTIFDTTNSHCYDQLAKAFLFSHPSPSSSLA
ncbi:MAG TPA: hypothetical protein VGN39_11065 [Terriglobales bacterium]|nr:hypothetical protein [Terriglobales bacterium]